MTSFIDCFNNFILTGNELFDCDEGTIYFKLYFKKIGNSYEKHIVINASLKNSDSNAVKKVILYIIRNNTTKITFTDEYNKLHLYNINPESDLFYDHKFICINNSAILVHKYITVEDYIKEYSFCF
jgi:hypothetical protein